MTKKAIIIGAGIGGLALGNILQKAGYNVHIYEKNDQLGGRAGQVTIDGYRYDTGPSWYLMPEVFEHYFELFDHDVKKDLELFRLTPAYKVFFESEPPITIQGNLKQDSKTFEKIEAGAGEALHRYVQESSSRYHLALKHFLYTNFSSVRPLMHRDIISRLGTLASALTTPLHKSVARTVKSQVLQQVLEYPMVFLGTSPFSAPSLYSLMSALDFEKGVYYPKNGIYSIIDLLVSIGQELGVSYHLSQPIKSILVDGKKATGVVLSSGKKATADLVVSNADLHFTETNLLPESAQSFPTSYWKKKEPGISALLLYLGVNGSLPNLEHHNLFFGDDWQQTFEAIYDHKTIPDKPSFYVSRTTKTDPSTGPSSHENLFVLVPLPSGKNFTKKELDVLTHETIAEIGTIVSDPQFAKRVTINKSFGPNDFASQYNAWEGTALGPSHILTQSALFRTANKSKKLSNLYYVGGATMPGIGLPMCLISAELVYKRLAGDHSSSPIDSIKEISK